MSAPARVLLADPAWLFDDPLPGRARGAAKHYSCLTVAELKRYPLPPLAADCLLLMWRVAAMQREALDVAEAWGFTVKSEIVWDKLTRTGKPHFGMGRYVRNSHETCLLATRGCVRVADRAVRSRFEAPVQEHSRKPDEMYAIAERLIPGGPYVELFARRLRVGWTQYGDELGAAKRTRYDARA
jgi:N6-adenosine-specific RNA methylase IME4